MLTGARVRHRCTATAQPARGHTQGMPSPSNQGHTASRQGLRQGQTRHHATWAEGVALPSAGRYNGHHAVVAAQEGPLAAHRPAGPVAGTGACQARPHTCASPIRGINLQLRLPLPQDPGVHSSQVWARQQARPTPHAPCMHCTLQRCATGWACSLQPTRTSNSPKQEGPAPNP